MVARKSGTIINVSSVAGRKTFPNHVAYVGTKFAVHGISENLREELSPSNVRVITIAPGAVETELLGHTTDAAIKSGYQAWKQAMGGTVLSADDVASAIAYAISSRSMCAFVRSCWPQRASSRKPMGSYLPAPTVVRHCLGDLSSARRRSMKRFLGFAGSVTGLFRTLHGRLRFAPVADKTPRAECAKW